PLPEGAVAAAGSEVKATRRASQLAAEHGLELSAIATSGILREKDVLRHLEASGGIHPLDAEERFAAGLDPGGRRPVLIHGAGQHARVVVELCAQACPELVIVGALDDRAAPGVEILGVPLIGRMSALDSLREAGVDQLLMGVGAIVQNSLRVGNYQRAIEAGFEVPALIHPRACVEPSARVGAGAQILANATVGGSVVIHEDVIVNSGAVVSHDCVIGAHSHITPGALLAGGVTIGDDSVVGMGATVYLGVRIGAGVRIGNGAHVFRDLPDGTLVRPGELV
ncbi:MAG: acetyltransferase, partial [Myxococcales bacterium]|nr:acetyltransferase [Myxococcales bacterium]